MKVLFYNHTAHVSGAERVLLLFIERLDETGIEPVAVCPEGDMANEIRGRGVNTRVVPELTARFTLNPVKIAKYLWSLRLTVGSLRKQIAECAPDVIHANSIRAGIAALLASTGTGLTVFWHIHDELKPHPLSTAIRLLVLSSQRSRIIAVSHATAISFAGRILRSGRSNRRITVIHNAVDLQRVDTQSPGPDLKTDLGLPTEAFLFGIVGQITPRKGQMELVKAFAKVAETLPNTRLLIVGRPIFNEDDAYLAKVGEAVAEAGLANRVLFLGHRSDVVRIIKQLDTLIINSSSEAFVMVAIEAMACRTPVIATDVGGTREMIEHGKSGLLIDPDDPDQLIAAMKTMYHGKAMRTEFARVGRTTVEQRLNAERFTAEVASALLFAASKGERAAPPVLETRLNEN